MKRKVKKAEIVVSRHRRLVPIKEACEYARISRSKLYLKMAANVIKAYKRDGKTMVDLNTIDDMHDTLPEFVPGGRKRRVSKPVEGIN